jgi:hypothetical protein
MLTVTIDLDMLTLQAYSENKVTLDSLVNTTTNNEVPKANEFLQDQNSNKKIKRPPNSYIIFTKLLNMNGLFDITRKFCEKHKINKQKMIPISKKISKILWEELSTVHKKIFSDLAIEVEKEHKRLYPSYKYQPIRRKSNGAKFKEYKPKIKPADHISIPTNNTSTHVFITSQDENDEFEQMDEDGYEDSHEGSFEDSHEESYEDSFGSSYSSYGSSYGGSYGSSHGSSYGGSYGGNNFGGNYGDSYEGNYRSNYEDNYGYKDLNSYDDGLPKFYEPQY